MTALGYSFWVVMPGFVKDDLGVGTTGLGAMLGMTALGGLIGSVLVASLADSKRAPLYLKSASALVAVSLFAVGFAPSFLLVMMIMVLVGVGVSAFQTLNNSIALRQADPRYYGRVMGLMQIAWGLINLLSLPTGFIADAIGERAVLSGAGLILGVVVLGLALWDRRLSANERAAELTSPISRNGS
jgi:MFS transporter, FSR family, fosmidomycin resistance protein